MALAPGITDAQLPRPLIELDNSVGADRLFTRDERLDALAAYLAP